MTAERRGLATMLPASLVLLVTVAGLFIALVPVVRTPHCSALPYDFAGEPAIFFPGAQSPTYNGTPDPCNDGIRITLLSRWLGKSWWEGSTVGVRAARGFKRTNSTAMLDRTGIRIHGRITKRLLDDARATLLDTGEYRSVEIDVSHDPSVPGKVKVRTIVVEK